MKCINITIVNDELIESIEVFEVVLSSSLEQGTTVQRTVSVHIQDDDRKCIIYANYINVKRLLCYLLWLQFCY